MNWQADSDHTWHEISRVLQSAPRDPNLRILILAAHPDDETIGASMLLSRCPQSSIVFLTDGAPRNPSLWSSGLSCSREEYASIRRREASVALNWAGIAAEHILHLDAMDQEAIFEVTSLASAFAGMIEKLRPAVLVAHSYEGGHPDHDAAALVAFLSLSMFNERARPPLLEMTSYHARNGQCVTGKFLEQRPALELCLELSVDDRERKRRMMNAYSSQHLVLENFPIDREPLRLAPKYDFTRPPHPGQLWYECMGWSMTGTRWRELAAAALTGFQEHVCH
jgi:N-acetylglucosamine malate deacetylase 2